MTGQNYEHLKALVVEKLKELCEVFVTNVCAYAILSNHYHTILHVNAEIERWRKLFGGCVLIERYLAGECKTATELEKVTDLQLLKKIFFEKIS